MNSPNSHRYLVLLACLLAGCTTDKALETDKKVVCTLEGKAYLVTARVGDLSWLQRIEPADLLCKERK